MKASDETISYWKQQVQAFEKSGLNRTTYCEQNQIKVFQLDYWRHKFAKPKNLSSKPGWIPLCIKESSAERSGGIRLKIGKLEIEVREGSIENCLLRCFALSAWPPEHRDGGAVSLGCPPQKIHSQNLRAWTYIIFDPFQC
jgi:hypothetical protein